MRVSFVILLVAGACAAPGVARADELGASRLVGMAQSGVGAAGGIDAFGVNPSMIGYGVRAWAFTVFPAGGYVLPLIGLGHGANAKFAVSDLQLMLSRLDIFVDAQYRSRIVDGVDLGAVVFRTEGTIAALALPLDAENTIGFHVMQRAAGRYSLADGIAETLHNVAVSADVSHLLLDNPLTAEGVWYNEYAASYAFAPLTESGIPDYRIGASVKFIQGLGYINVQGKRLSTIPLGYVPALGSPATQVQIAYDVTLANAGSFDANTLPLGPLFSPFPASVGAGFGVDVGVARTMPFGTGTLTAALSLVDVGAIQWNNHPTLRHVDRIDTFATGGQSLALDTLRQYTGTARATGAFSTSLPARLHLGVAIESFVPRGITPRTLTFEFEQGLDDVVGNSTSPRIAAGGEWRRGIWRWATGLSFNADEHFGWSMGGGVLLFQHAQFDFALGRVNGLWEAPQLVNMVARVTVLY